MNTRHNLIVTGIPRSGTTLLSALIDGMEDAACLNEPHWQPEFISKHTSLSAKEFAKWLVGDFTETRIKLLCQEPIPERRATDGSQLTNYYTRQPDKQHVRRNYRMVGFTRAGLSPEFLLGIKHNGLYIGILNELAMLEHFTIIAIVRNPVHVIRSWRTIQNEIPPSKGDLPGARIFWPELQELAGGPSDLLFKQIKLYDMVCERFFRLKDRIHLLRYEDVLREPEIISRLLQRPIRNTELVDRDYAPSYLVDEESQRIAREVTEHGRYIPFFYSDEEIRG